MESLNDNSLARPPTSTATMPQNIYAQEWPEQYNSNVCYQMNRYDWQENSYIQFQRPIEEQKYIQHADFNGYNHQPLTAIGKPLDLFGDFYTKRESKPMKQWSPREVMEWLCEEVHKCNYEYESLKLENFRDVDGCTLLAMTQQQFSEKDNNFGNFLYQALEKHRRIEGAQQDDNLPSFKNLRYPDDGVVYTDLSESIGCRPVNSDNDSFISDASSHEALDVKPPTEVAAKAPAPTGRRPVGRPPKPTRTKRGNKEKKCGRLWEFIRDLLLKPEYCPSLICWENHEEGIFRFVRSDKVAELWGTIKENPKMTYEKLSRAMRYYYKSKVLQPVLGRRLVYKFGPTARGWRTNNPNFRDGPK